MDNILEKINEPKDLKKLNINELEKLSDEIRQTIIKRVKVTGGHMASNLGMVEATVALHYVFNSPVDKFIFDVSHQCYTHKILTGRKEAFTNPDKYYSVSGFTTPSESEHDLFKIGHSSTSISLGAGMAKMRDLKNGKESIIAIIGDGAMSGGEAFEGLNTASELKSNFIILFNDNEMSIAPNSGGMYQNFALLRETKGKAENNFFKIFGFDYYYVDNGNDVKELIDVLSKVKDTTKPTVVHIHTTKGKGLKEAEEDKEKWHSIHSSSFDEEKTPNILGYSRLTAKYLLEKIKKDKSVVVISPGTPSNYGLTPEFREKAGKQFIDVGIAEQHAVSFASGVAKAQGKPVLIGNSSFLQRAYDQLQQDLALNNNPATIIIFKGGVAGGDATHSGAYDISIINNIPNIVCLAPTTKEEYIQMLDWSIEQNEHPVVIRVPNKFVSRKDTSKFDETVINKAQVKQEGNKVAIIGLGSFYYLGEQVASILKDKYNITPTIINPRNYSSLDVNTLNRLKENHNTVVTLEDGIVNGGYGEKITRFYSSSNMKVLNFGGEKEFNDLLPLNEIHRKCHLEPNQIVDDIMKL